MNGLAWSSPPDVVRVGEISGRFDESERWRERDLTCEDDEEVLGERKEVVLKALCGGVTKGEPSMEDVGVI